MTSKHKTLQAAALAAVTGLSACALAFAGGGEAMSIKDTVNAQYLRDYDGLFLSMVKNNPGDQEGGRQVDVPHTDFSWTRIPFTAVSIRDDFDFMADGVTKTDLPVNQQAWVECVAFVRWADPGVDIGHAEIAARVSLVYTNGATKPLGEDRRVWAGPTGYSFPCFPWLLMPGDSLRLELYQNNEAGIVLSHEFAYLLVRQIGEDISDIALPYDYH